MEQRVTRLPSSHRDPATERAPAPAQPCWPVCRGPRTPRASTWPARARAWSGASVSATLSLHVLPPRPPLSALSPRGSFCSWTRQAFPTSGLCRAAAGQGVPPPQHAHPPRPCLKLSVISEAFARAVLPHGAPPCRWPLWSGHFLAAFADHYQRRGPPSPSCDAACAVSVSPPSQTGIMWSSCPDGSQPRACSLDLRTSSPPRGLASPCRVRAGLGASRHLSSLTPWARDPPSELVILVALGWVFCFHFEVFGNI